MNKFVIVILSLATACKEGLTVHSKGKQELPD